MFDLIINNQELFLNLLAGLLVILIGWLFKRQVDKSKLITALSMILDIIQDIANKRPNATNEAKKQLAIDAVTAALPAKKLSLVKKVFGTLGGAIEFVWKNRSTLITATAILLKKVF